MRIENFAGTRHALGLEPRRGIGHIELIVDAQAIPIAGTGVARQRFEPTVAGRRESLPQRPAFTTFQHQLDALCTGRPETKRRAISAGLGAELQRITIAHSNTHRAYLRYAG